MASLLNASTAGPGGLISTGDSSGVLSLQTAGTTALTVTSGQYVTLVNGISNGLNVSGGGWGVLPYTANSTVIDNNSGQTRIFATGANTTTYGTLLSYAGTTNGSATLVTTVGKDLTFALQGATQSSGTGIAFPASQSASTDVNTLDDYEEGTFTPTILFGGNNTGMVYNRQYAKYTKIGNRVFINMYVSIYPTKGSSTGTATVAGLPFQNVNDGNGSAGAQTACAFNPPQILYSGSVNAYVENNATYIQLATVTEGGFNSGMTDANFQNNSVVQIMCHYQTS